MAGLIEQIRDGLVEPTQAQLDGVAQTTRAVDSDPSLWSVLLDPFLTNFWGTAESVATLAAILVGGFWTYRLFVRRRTSRPRLNLHVALASSPAPDSKRLLQIRIELENIGDVLIRLGEVTTWVQQINPTPDEALEHLTAHDPLAETGTREIPWPRIATRRFSFPPGEAEIEPGETDQVTYDFLIADEVSELQVYTYFKNVSKKGREIGWGRTLRAELPALKRSGPPGSEILFPLETYDMSGTDTRSPKRVEKQQPPRTPPGKLDEQQIPKSPPPAKDPGKTK